MQQQQIIGAGAPLRKQESAPMNAFRKSKMGKAMPKKKCKGCSYKSP